MPKGHSSNTIDARIVDKAVALFSKRFGAEVLVRPLTTKGRVLVVEFSGNICQTCCTYDYFDDFTLVLEKVSNVPYAVWEVFKTSGNAFHLIVKFVKLDFLEEIRSAIGNVDGIVKHRMSEFARIGRDEKSLFKEMCFCILTANCTAEGGIKIQQNLEDGFYSLTKDELVKAFRALGYRFPNIRAGYIVENRELYGSLLETLGRFKDGKTAREWLIRNVKGLGYKEASHFLRNSGFKDVAIIDRHILKYLSSRNLVEIPRTLTKRRYLEYERLLCAIAKKLDLNLAELDLFLWYIMTGKVLK